MGEKFIRSWLLSSSQMDLNTITDCYVRLCCFSFGCGCATAVVCMCVFVGVCQCIIYIYIYIKCIYLRVWLHQVYASFVSVSAHDVCLGACRYIQTILCVCVFQVSKWPMNPPKGCVPTCCGPTWTIPSLTPASSMAATRSVAVIPPALSWTQLKGLAWL